MKGVERKREKDRVGTRGRVMNYIKIKKVSISGCLITKLDDRVEGYVCEDKNGTTLHH
jgi:hypothetical protein